MSRKDVGMGIMFFAIAFASVPILYLVNLPFQYSCLLWLLLLASVLGGSYYIRKGLYGAEEYYIPSCLNLEGCEETVVLRKGVRRFQPQAFHTSGFLVPPLRD